MSLGIGPEGIRRSTMEPLGVGAPVKKMVASAEQCASAEEAFEQHFSLVWRGLRRLGVVEAALDDAAQDVFLVVHRRWEDFQQQSSLKTWIYGIVMRVASDHTRRAKRDSARFTATELELASTLASPDQLLAQRQAGRQLHCALEQLSEAERQVLVLVDLEEQSVVEAAASLGIKTNTAYTRLRRARKSFERALVSNEAPTTSSEKGWF